MPAHFCLTVRFLQPYSHGRGASGDPEWPPSPLRVFQALVAAAAARWNERTKVETAAPALRWLECRPTPSIVAAAGIPSEVPYRLYVPDNVADKVAKSWAKGGEGSIADYRTEKDVRPTHLMGEAVHYLFPLPDGRCPELDILAGAARSITHLGWGVDMVAGNAAVLSEEEAARLPGERWRPVEGSAAEGLRVPVEGTLNDLANKHAAFLDRLSEGGFKPVPPLTAFRVVGYRRDTDPAQRPYAAFSLLKLDAGGFRPFDTTRHTRTVAGMVRHAVAQAAARAGWEPARVATYVHGHTPEGGVARGAPDLPRFSYLPLPSIEYRDGGNRVTAIRRVIVSAPAGEDAAVAWLRRALSGQELVCEKTGELVALLSLLPQTDRALKDFVAPSPVWSTVTPMVMTGHDDNNPAKAERLIRKSLAQAGVPDELARCADLEWRRVGFRAGVELATRYDVPACLDRRSRYHVQIRWLDASRNPVLVAGPLAIGAGRYGGLGLLAAHRRERESG